MGFSYNGEEHRKHVRIHKNFTLSFHFIDVPGNKSDGSTVKDISRGGVRFTSSYPIKVDTHMVFEIAVPYIAPNKLRLEAMVISCKEISYRLVYEIRAKFVFLNQQALEIIDLIEKQNLKDRKNDGLH